MTEQDKLQIRQIKIELIALTRLHSHFYKNLDVRLKRLRLHLPDNSFIEEADLLKGEANNVQQLFYALRDGFEMRMEQIQARYR
jgi:hypothetical protein